MADPYLRGGGPGGEHYMRGLFGGQPQQYSMSVSVVKAAVSAAAGGAMLLLSGLTLTGTVIALVVATPLLVICSPVLVPAAIAVALLAGGFLSSGGFGVAALSVLSWMYRYVTGRHPMGADELDHARARMASKAHDIKESAQHRIDQARAS